VIYTIDFTIFFPFPPESRFPQRGNFDAGAWIFCERPSSRCISFGGKKPVFWVDSLGRRGVALFERFSCTMASERPKRNRRPSSRVTFGDDVEEIVRERKRTFLAPPSSTDSESELSDEEEDVGGALDDESAGESLASSSSSSSAFREEKGERKTSAARKLEDAKWKPPNAPNVRASRWPPPFQPKRGIKVKMKADASPLDFFQLYISDKEFSLFAKESMRYAKDHLNLELSTDANEMKRFIGVCVMCGVSPSPKLSMHWSFPTQNTEIAMAMPFDRFELLLRCFHLNDNNKAKPHGHKNFDKLFKVRPFLDRVTKKLTDVYQPSREITLDETMISTKSRIDFLVFLKGKPHPWGIKVVAVCEASTGYLCHPLIFTGKKHMSVSTVELSWNALSPFLDKHHVVVCDRFYTSVVLFERLLQRSTYAVGTILPSRAKFPSSLPDLASDLRRGESVSLVRDQRFVATAWHDSKVVFGLSTAHSAHDNAVVSRRRKGDSTLILHCPDLLAFYNETKSGVDRFNAMMAAYHCGIESHRWWLYVFFYLLEVVIINSFILDSQQPGERTYKTHAEFRLALSLYLVRQGTSRKHPLPMQPKSNKFTRLVESLAGDSDSEREERKEVLIHCHENRPSPKGACSVCSYRTTWFCPKCVKFMCSPIKRACWKEHHQDLARHGRL
jgi:hypothetical protein